MSASSTAALSALAGSFLSRPLATFTHSPSDAADDDDDDEPLFYSSHPSKPPAPRQPTAPPPSSTTGPAAHGSTDSLPRLFHSTDSLFHHGPSTGPDEGDEEEDDGSGRSRGALAGKGAIDQSAGFGPLATTAGDLLPSSAAAAVDFDDGQSVIFDVDQPLSSSAYAEEEDEDLGGAGAGGYLGQRDEDERRAFLAVAQAAPPASTARQPSTGGKGWLAHQSAYPASGPAGAASGSGRRHHHHQRGRSTSTSSTASAESDISSSTVSSSTASTRSTSSATSSRSASPTLPGRFATSSTTTAQTRPPRAPSPLANSRSHPGAPALAWAKYHDPLPLAAFCAGLAAVIGLAPFTLGWSAPATDAPQGGAPQTPFRTLLHALPLTSLLVALAALAPPALLWGLRASVRWALMGAAGLGVVLLGAVGWAAVVGSLDGGGWWGTTGLRLLALVPLVSAALYGRNLYLRRSGVERTVRVVELACTVLLDHPPLLLLSPCLLLAFGVLSSVFLLVWCRLFLIGWWESPEQGTYHYHLRAYAVWLLVLVGCLWVWAWNVVRGVRRVVVAGVVGEWYFHRTDHPTRPADPDPFGLGLDVSDVRVAWERATGKSFGSVCLGAGVSGCLMGLKAAAEGVRRATSPTTLSSLPQLFSPLAAVHPLALLAVAALEQMNAYVLVYVGIAGKGYAESTRAVAGLVRRRGREAGRKILDYTLLKTLLSLLSFAISAAAALTAYLFTAHALSAEGHAPIVALLCGGSVWTTVRFGVDGLADAADALFVCFAIDEENGGGRCAEAKEAFGGPKRGPTRVDV